MRLRGRFTLWFALAALVPIAVAALITRDVVSRNYTSKFERERKSAERNLRRELSRLEQSVTRVASDMVAETRRHPLVAGVVLELRKGEGTLPANTRRRIARESKDFKHGLGLDVLFLVDTADEVLAAPHYHDAENNVHPELRQRALDTDGKALYIREPMIREGQIVAVLVAESARMFRQGRHRIVVVAGREIDSELLDAIRQPKQINARVVDDQGRVLVAPPLSQPWDETASDKFAIPLAGPDGHTVAMIEVVVSRAELVRVLSQVTIAALVLAAAALLVTILLGLFVARRMTAHLDRLVEGAQAAASGDLDHRVDIKSRDEIGEVATSFNVMMEELKTSKERLVLAERVAAWQEIARRLAHEIKNPLTPIQMSVETMRKTWSKKHPSFEEIFEESTATVLEETARLKRIVGEFSEFARLPKPTVVPLDLSEVVAGYLTLYEGAIPFTRKLDDNLPPILADRDQLSQILLNLLENARDAVGKRSDESGDGEIVVETRLSSAGKWIELIIEDNGPGLPDPVKEKLFTPYFTTKQGGTGLGLAIVHRMISEHRGRIVAGDSSLGGARFLVQFPVSQEPIATRLQSSSEE